MPAEAEKQKPALLQRGRRGLRFVLVSWALRTLLPLPQLGARCCPASLQPAQGCPITIREPTLLLSAGCSLEPLSLLEPLFQAPRACLLQHTSSSAQIQWSQIL